MAGLNAISTLSGTVSARGSLSGTVSARGNLSGTISIAQSGGGTTPLVPATTDTLGGIIVGDDLSITPEGRLSVLKATSVEQDNTRPITAAAVYTEVGNITALLQTI